jgi:hypothetical protein
MRPGVDVMRPTREQVLAERDLARADVRRLASALASRDLEILRLKMEIARLVRERGDLLVDDERARAAMVAVAIVLMWRYLLWRWLGSLPPLGLTVE